MRAAKLFPGLFRDASAVAAEKIIATPRLRLRSVSTADAPSIARYAGDWDVARMTARVPYPYSRALAHHWIDDLADGEVVRVIECEGVFIGICGYTPDGRGGAEIGYWIAKPWWGQGFATEAAQALIDHCFGRARFNRLFCNHFADNPASARIIEKLGFRLIGRDALWCEARQAFVEALRYERQRPARVRLRLRAA